MMENNRFLSDVAAGLTPYVPGEQPKDRQYIKLNTNENPYPPSPRVMEAIAEISDDLRLYPDPDVSAVCRAAADYYNKKLGIHLKETNVFVGNGSDEVLALAFPAFFSGGKVVFPNITYSFYPVYAGLFQSEILEIPLKDDFSIDLADYTDRKESGAWDGVRGILIPNPNAPTGRCLKLFEIEELLKANPDCVVLIDEAYVDFGGESAVGLTEAYENLLVVQTMSKSRSLAGLRVGFAIGSELLIEGLNRVKNSFNSYTIDRLASAGGVAALEDEAYFLETTEKVMATRERGAASMEAMGFQVIPSKANFLFISHFRIPAEEIFTELRKRGVLVRYFKKPLIDNFLRVSIGTDEEMDVCLRELNEIINR